MWNDGLREAVVPHLRFAAKIVTAVAFLTLLKHSQSICEWYVANVGWPPTIGMIAGLGLVMLYAVALVVIALCACAIRGEVDSAYLTFVLTSSVLLGTAIGPFVPATFRTPPTVSMYMFNGIAVVMLMWVAVTFAWAVVMAVYYLVQIARVLHGEFVEYVQDIRWELARKRE
jgi:hypothetical protein